MPGPEGAVADVAERNDKAAGGKNFWTRKYGPLPGWGWSLIAAGAAVAWYLWHSKEKSAAGAITGSGTATTGTGWENAVAALQDEIDALQNGVTGTAIAGTGGGGGSSGGGGGSTGAGTGQTNHPTPGTGSGGGGSGTKPKKPAPKKATYHRHVATGTLSLNAVAKARHTTASHIIGTTRSSHGTGHGINAKNLAKFNAYVAKGTGKKMPAGLVYYTTN